MEKIKAIKQAVILAGGAGVRLRPLTNDRPKPMVLVNGRPFLEYLIDLLRENGIEEVVLLLGYLPNKIIEHFGDGSRFGIKIKYHVGEVNDENGARIRNAKHLLDEVFLLMYCDNYWPLELSRMFDFYLKEGVPAMVTVYNNKDSGGEYGWKNNFKISDSDLVLHYGVLSEDSQFQGLDIGFFILDKSIIEEMPGSNFNFQSEFLPEVIKKGKLAAYRTDHPYYTITSPEFLDITQRFLEPKKVIFLDRDGVINKKMPEHDYVKNWNEFKFLPGVIEALKLLTQNSYKIFVITNQRGVGRGIMTHEDLRNIHEKMKKELKKQGVILNGIYCCSHDESDNCNCRKPKAGLFFKAARDHYIDLTKAIFVGDDENDLRAGEAARCKTFLVEPGRGLLKIVKFIINQ